MVCSSRIHCLLSCRCALSILVFASEGQAAFDNRDSSCMLVDFYLTKHFEGSKIQTVTVWVI